ncbi:glutathione peroxidase [Brachybacterium sp. DNPG3]
MSTLSDFSATAIDGSPTALSQHLGSVVLVVNTASQCGLTPQYEGLQALHERFGEQGLTVLGFPCDQFGHQEPGTESEIAQFCSTSYGVTFPLHAKVEVNGDGAHPLYQWLTGAHETPAGSTIEPGDIAWNFTKFLLDREGRVIARFEPTVTPDELTGPIEDALAAKA